jgi:hypothetical protein
MAGAEEDLQRSAAARAVAPSGMHQRRKEAMHGHAAPARIVAAEFARLSMQEIEDGSVVGCESSFYEIPVGGTVGGTLTGPEGDAAVAPLVAAS